MASATRERLLDAAEVLFAEHGFTSVGVRQLIERADASNGAAVGYHFGSKDALYVEAVDRIAAPLRRQYAETLDQMASDAPAEALINALVRPLVDLRRGRGGAAKAGLLGRDAIDRPYGASAFHALLTPFERALWRETDRPDAEWQLAAAGAPLVLFLMDRLPQLPREPRSVTSDRLVVAVSGALALDIAHP